MTERTPPIEPSPPPPPPRSSRWSHAIARRPFWGILGLSLVISGVGLIVLLRAAGVGVPFEDEALDRAATLTRGTVIAIERHPRRTEVLVRFRYRAPTTIGIDTIESSSFTTAEPPSMGSEQPIEYLADEPRVARIAGMRRTLRGVWMNVAFGVVVLPGILLVLFWLRRVLRDKLLLSTGTAVPIEVERIDGTANLRVHYRFVAPGGASWSGDERVPAPSRLGQSITKGSKTWVLFDPERPQSRMLARPEWFADGGGSDA